MRLQIAQPKLCFNTVEFVLQRGGDLRAESYIILCHASCVDEEYDEEDEEGDNALIEMVMTTNTQMDYLLKLQVITFHCIYTEPILSGGNFMS